MGYAALSPAGRRPVRTALSKARANQFSTSMREPITPSLMRFTWYVTDTDMGAPPPVRILPTPSVPNGPAPDGTGSRAGTPAVPASARGALDRETAGNVAGIRKGGSREKVGQ